jgi:tetratricopeptide (TPR) repeat protein
LSGIAEALSALAAIEVAAGNPWPARDRFERALAILRAEGDKVRLVSPLSNYSTFLITYNEPDAAREAAQEAIQLHKELGGTLVVAWQLRVLAWCEWWVGDWRAAWKAIDEGNAILKGSVDYLNVGLMFELAGHFAREMGDLERAEAFIEQSLAAFQVINSEHFIHLATSVLGAIRLDQGRIGEAEQIMTALMSQPVWLKEQRYRARAFDNLGAIALAKEDWQDATKHLSHGLRDCLEHDFYRYVPLLLERLSVLAQATGDASKAARLLGASDEVRSKFRLAVTPYRDKLLRPVIDSLLAELGPDGFEAAKDEGRGLELLVAAGMSLRSEAMVAEA